MTALPRSLIVLGFVAGAVQGLVGLAQTLGGSFDGAARLGSGFLIVVLAAELYAALYWRSDDD